MSDNPFEQGISTKSYLGFISSQIENLEVGESIKLEIHNGSRECEDKLNTLAGGVIVKTPNRLVLWARASIQAYSLRTGYKFKTKTDTNWNLWVMRVPTLGGEL